MKRTVIAATALVIGFAANAGAQPRVSFDNAVKKVEAEFTPANAKPGETVTLEVTAKLAPLWYTYPAVQADKRAKTQVNSFTLPGADSGLEFGKVVDPSEYKTKAEPILGIKELRYLPGSPTWKIATKVPAGTKPGKYPVKVAIEMQVCGRPSFEAKDDVCLRPKTVTVSAVLVVE